MTRDHLIVIVVMVVSMVVLTRIWPVRTYGDRLEMLGALVVAGLIAGGVTFAIYTLLH
jgi:hypothetical protein